MPAVICVHGPFLMFWIAIPAARDEIMRDAENGVLRVEKVDFTVGITIHGHAEGRRLELHQANSAGWRTRNRENVPAIGDGSLQQQSELTGGEFLPVRKAR